MDLKWYSGENVQSALSFMHLVMNANQGYDYYAFADQDDCWDEDKLISAINKLCDLDSMVPSLYYSGQMITDSDLHFLQFHDLDPSRSFLLNIFLTRLQVVQWFLTRLF